jgi:hypothetical protein
VYKLSSSQICGASGQGSLEAGFEPLTTMKMDQKVTQDELPRIEPFSASAELAGRYSVKPMSSPTTPQ